MIKIPRNYQSFRNDANSANNPIKALAGRIVLQAINDYFAIRTERIKPNNFVNIPELYNFFHSEYFFLLSGRDGDEAWEKLNNDFNKGIIYNFHY